MTKPLRINFFPLKDRAVSVQCYRRRCVVPNEEKPDLEHYRFKEDRRSNNDESWWLTVSAHEGYETYAFKASDQPMAARWVLSRLLYEELAKKIEGSGPYKATLRPGLCPKLEVRVKRCADYGWQGFLLEFDWHQELRCHGLYVNFHFFKDEQACFNEAIQKLSLSLDNNGRPNRDFYRSQWDWVRSFGERFLCGVSFRIGESDLEFASQATLVSRSLRGKTFLFKDRSENKSSYWGLKKVGPYQACRDEPTFFFVFRSEYIQAARYLYECLSGREFPERFPGMLEYFNVPFGKENVRHIIMTGGDREAHANAAKEIAATGCKNPVAIVLVTGDELEYLLQKSCYLALGIPSQDVQIDKVRSGRAFQWSVAGIALQLFCKSGGVPWCVKTEHEGDLIIGVSQLWIRNEDEMSRLVAYSVTTDANGCFKDIRTLSNNTNEIDYVRELGRRIKVQLDERIKVDNPRRIVLHCSFRLLNSAMDEIRRVARSVVETGATTQIVIMRINTEHHYQGFDPSRETMVPDENAILKIKRHAYLVWPEGTPAGGIVSTRPSGPVLVSFDQAEPSLTETDESELLQDLCNLAGANWRGFNAKARPVSVFYCHLVGKMIADMTKWDLAVPAIEKFVPWFL